MPSKLRRLFNAFSFLRKVKKIKKDKNGRRIFEFARDNRKKFNFSKRVAWFLSVSNVKALRIAGKPWN
jgi:hypothetical protein